MSRTQAKREFKGETLQKNMQQRGIYVKAVSMRGLAEEAGASYKDINEVVHTLDVSGISKPVVRLLPIGNVKGTGNLSSLNLMVLLILLIALFCTLIL